jgi:hypothetical protein
MAEASRDGSKTTVHCRPFTPSQTVGASSYLAEMCHNRRSTAKEVVRAK